MPLVGPLTTHTLHLAPRLIGNLQSGQNFVGPVLHPSWSCWTLMGWVWSMNLSALSSHFCHLVTWTTKCVILKFQWAEWKDQYLTNPYQQFAPSSVKTMSWSIAKPLRFSTEMSLTVLQKYTVVTTLHHTLNSSLSDTMLMVIDCLDLWWYAHWKVVVGGPGQ